MDESYMPAVFSYFRQSRKQKSRCHEDSGEESGGKNTQSEMADCRFTTLMVFSDSSSGP